MSQRKFPGGMECLEEAGCWSVSDLIARGLAFFPSELLLISSELLMSAEWPGRIFLE
jgi:hypothetical protein